MQNFWKLACWTRLKYELLWTAIWSKSLLFPARKILQLLFRLWSWMQRIQKDWSCPAINDIIQTGNPEWFRPKIDPKKTCIISQQYDSLCERPRIDSNFIKFNNQFLDLNRKKPTKTIQQIGGETTWYTHQLLSDS